MEPPPDHGEKSYKGSGRLAGRRALITGTIPGWVAPRRAYAREGADDAINYLSSEESDAQEFISLIKAEGRVGIRPRATSVTRASARSWLPIPSKGSAVLTSS